MAGSGARWLITGAGGALGYDLVRALAGREVTALDRAALDISDAAAVDRAVADHDVVVNAAAWTAVDDAETQEAEAFAANAVGPANLARACTRHGAFLVQVSTDYVFDGNARTPYPEDAPLAPASAYGRTKAAGEWAVRALAPDRSAIVRTAWLYGERGPNFVRTMLRLESEREFLSVVEDQVGQPTATTDVAARIVALVDSGAPAGTYHATNSGQVSWCGFTREIFGLVGADPARVRPCSTDAFPRPAPRPPWSVLGHDGWAAAGLTPLRPWQDALAEVLPAMLLTSATSAHGGGR